MDVFEPLGGSYKTKKSTHTNTCMQKEGMEHANSMQKGPIQYFLCCHKTDGGAIWGIMLTLHFRHLKTVCICRKSDPGLTCIWRLVLDEPSIRYGWKPSLPRDLAAVNVELASYIQSYIQSNASNEFLLRW